MTVDPLLAAFCRAVQERREDLGLSQEELAGRAGLHRTYISDIERGSRNLSLRSLTRLSLALEIPVSSLIRAAEWKAASGVSLEVRRSYVRDGNSRHNSGNMNLANSFNTATGLMLGSKEHDNGTEPQQQCQLCEGHSEFMETLARDMKGPVIGADQALASLLSGDLGRLGPGQAKVLSIIKQNNDGLLALVHELLGANHQQPASLRFESCDLGAIILSCVETFQPIADSQGIAVTAKIQPQLQNIQADGLAMRRLFVNLLESCLRSTSSGGSIEISGQSVTGFAIVEIKDSGSTYDSNEYQAMFEPSAQGRKFKRLGVSLGLYVCRKIAEAHGGEITCQDVGPSACVFSIRLPAGQAQ